MEIWLELQSTVESPGVSVHTRGRRKKRTWADLAYQVFSQSPFLGSYSGYYHSGGLFLSWRVGSLGLREGTSLAPNWVVVSWGVSHSASHPGLRRESR